MAATLIPRSAGELVPWANGLGMSRVIFGLDGPASRSQASPGHCRLSSTRIERDCPFSFYPGLDRTIVLLGGNGFELVHDAIETQVAAHRFDTLRFHGDRQTHCRLLDGPVEVLNLMASRDFARCELVAMTLAETPSRHRLTPSVRALYLLGGAVEARLGGDPILVMQAGDALRFDGSEPVELELRATGLPADLAFLQVQ